MGRFHSLRRILLNGLTGVSAVLFVGTVALWGRSYWREDRISFYGEHEENIETGYIATSHWGQFWLGLVWDDSEAFGPSTLRGFYLRSIHVPLEPGALWKFEWSSAPGLSYFVFPIWLVALATAILPTAALIRIRRRRANLRLRCCANCGYDLRASPGRCPECGASAFGMR